MHSDYESLSDLRVGSTSENENKNCVSNFVYDIIQIPILYLNLYKKHVL